MSTIDSGHYGDVVARRTKRLWTDEEKRSICFQTAAPGVSVAQVARRYAVNANLIFKWLRDPRYAPDPASVPPPSEAARFLPVEIVAEADGACDHTYYREPDRDRAGWRPPDADQRRV